MTVKFYSDLKADRTIEEKKEPSDKIMPVLSALKRISYLVLYPITTMMFHPVY